MALETVVYPQDMFSYVCKDLCSFGVGGGGGAWGYDYGFQEEEDKGAFIGDFDGNNVDQKIATNWETSPEDCQCSIDQPLPPGVLYPAVEHPPPPPTAGRRKRRRTRSTKNKEEIENQRMTHIAVERNRRKQMNEYLAVLRSIMPPSYVQRGDQASIIGGAINFVKELEQQLQFIKAYKDKTPKQTIDDNGDAGAGAGNYSLSPFADFFSFPQYSTRATQSKNFGNSNDSSSATATATGSASSSSVQANNHQWAAGDIEVTMVDSHANLKILSKRRPRQLLKMVAGFQSLRLTILHLNVTSTADQMVLYSVSIKVEEGCQLNTVDEIAGAVNQILLSIQDEAPGFS